MRRPHAILAIDQGTTSTKAIVLDEDGKILGSSLPDRFTIDVRYPRPGWVEFEPQQLLRSVCDSAKAAVAHANLSWSAIAGIGLANQGETVIAFDRATGRPIHPAISWQDCRTEAITNRWRQQGLEQDVLATTGLRLDPYFSAAKIAWILENVDEACTLQKAGRLGLGPSDAWLLHQLTGGEHFVTDVATASRTMLMDLATSQWSPQLAKSFGIAVDDLPRIVLNAEPIGLTAEPSFGAKVPITGLCVDQQAALLGHHAVESGQAKLTYGTGCFLLAHVGSDCSRRAAGLLTSVGWKTSEETAYVFDGGVYSAGSLMDWVCEIGLAADVDEVARLAREIDVPSPVLLIPAFSGLAAPRWASRARACWLGMDQSTDRRHLVRSALEAIAFRIKEIFDAMDDADFQLRRISVDGGLSRCDLLMQIQADVLDVPLARSDLAECTALGAGYFAGLGCGLWKSMAQLPSRIEPVRSFEPRASNAVRYEAAFDQWKNACTAVIQLFDS